VSAISRISALCANSNIASPCYNARGGESVETHRQSSMLSTIRPCSVTAKTGGKVSTVRSKSIAAAFWKEWELGRGTTVRGMEVASMESVSATIYGQGPFVKKKYVPSTVLDTECVISPQGSVCVTCRTLAEHAH